MTKQDKLLWLARCWVQCVPVGFGVLQYTAFHPSYPAPAGMVWVIGYGGDVPTADVLHSYTLPFFRRRGIRSLINAELLKEYSIIRTSGGSKEGGAAFLRAAGYTHDKVRGDYFLKRGKGARKA
jgi:GNAT superfamily N-acetyltransferase